MPRWIPIYKICRTRHNHCFIEPVDYFVPRSGRRRAGITAALFFLSFLSAKATTYYVDYSAGTDSNNGTSKSTPWKRCPGMAGFAGDYSHAAGDRFVFKGGVTWTDCFPMAISVGGSSDTVRDYYGTDVTWFTGDSFARAVFDFQNANLGGGVQSSGVYLTAGNITFGESMDLKRYRVYPGYGPMTIGSYGVRVSNVTISNCVIRDWDMATPLAPGTGGYGGGVGYFGGGGGNNLKIDHCTFTLSGSATKTGDCVTGFGDVSFSDFGYCASALHGGGNYHDNHIHDLLEGTDPTSHQAAIVTFGPSTIYNNLIHNITGRNAPIELGGNGITGDNWTDLVYNNVVYNAGVQTCVWAKADKVFAASYSLKMYNNTLEHGSGYCVALEVGGTGLGFGNLDARNNHFITSGKPILYNDPADGGANVKSAVIEHNLTQTPTQATEAGYVAGNNYQPMSGSVPTVNAGTNLSSVFTVDRLGASRRQEAAWDAGAYEYGAVSPSPTPILSPAAPTGLHLTRP
jgi:hypothetical protein